MRGCVSGAIYFLLVTATRNSVPASLHDAGKLGLNTLAIPSLYSKSLEILSLPDKWMAKKPSGRKGQAALAVSMIYESYHVHLTPYNSVDSII